MTRAVRVLVVDDQALIRAGLRGVLESESGVTVVGEAGDGDTAVRRVREGGVDVVLMDLRMPHVDGVEATRRLTADPGASSGVAVLVLTTFETDEHVLSAVAAGARGYLGKDSTPEALVDAVRVVARGETLLSARAMTALAAHATRAVSPPAPPRSSLAPLTDREREVVLLVARGLSNDEIALRLVISPLTAKTHVNRAMTKLGARDRAALVVTVHSSGLLGSP
ncbi:DNA-binding response regulator, NarL/FixJ family, contains REC and HTH domains [Lentzea fradiae]|uniref:DNA-binding response regulator, NarL/FixJ family, contains REC and HTH domains n=1 Tax=Lentzea fradiae TaxID=200378 RepID=A0A1G7WF13_9PSEU|nr:response regulator transcription factor [Lentzea fradiae]SDG70542.1 DNA-binding response regulator, NarL/FixJ family, contains REC and HTH domains [Lentzea fradiae]